MVWWCWWKEVVILERLGWWFDNKRKDDVSQFVWMGASLGKYTNMVIE